MKLAVWGANSYGQLGTGFKSELIAEPVFLDSIRLKQVPELSTIKSITGGGGHTLILFKDGSLYGCGWNNAGQLLGDEPIVLDIKRLPYLDEFNIIEVASKWDTTYAITADGLCLAWGSNAYSQLGYTTEEFVIARKPVIVGKDVVQVACGARHCILLKKDGTVQTAGDNKLGKLGRETAKIDAKFGQVEGLSNIKSIASGFNHSLAVSAEGKIYGWGCNKWGQLGKEPKCCRWTQIPVELNHENTGKVLSAHPGWSTTHILMKDGILANFGRNNYGQLGQVSSIEEWKVHILKNFQAISVGSEHTLGLTNEGLVSWGWNEHGSCGTGTVDNQPTPSTIKIGHSSSPRILLFAAISAHNYALIQEPQLNETIIVNK